MLQNDLVISFAFQSSTFVREFLAKIFIKRIICLFGVLVNKVDDKGVGFDSFDVLVSYF